MKNVFQYDQSLPTERKCLCCCGNWRTRKRRSSQEKISKLGIIFINFNHHQHYIFISHEILSKLLFLTVLNVLQRILLLPSWWNINWNPHVQILPPEDDGEFPLLKQRYGLVTAFLPFWLWPNRLTCFLVYIYQSSMNFLKCSCWIFFHSWLYIVSLYLWCM